MRTREVRRVPAPLGPREDINRGDCGWTMSEKAVIPLELVFGFADNPSQSFKNMSK